MLMAHYRPISASMATVAMRELEYNLQLTVSLRNDSESKRSEII